MIINLGGFMEISNDVVFKLSSYLISTLAFALPFLFAFRKAKEEGRLKDTVANVFSTIPLLMVKAEKLYGSGRGDQKLDYVLTQLRLLAYENAFQLNEEEAKKQVETVVETTKNVNANSNTNNQNQLGGKK